MIAWLTCEHHAKTVNPCVRHSQFRLYENGMAFSSVRFFRHHRFGVATAFALCADNLLTESTGIVIANTPLTCRVIVEKHVVASSFSLHAVQKARQNLIKAQPKTNLMKMLWGRRSKIRLTIESKHAKQKLLASLMRCKSIWILKWFVNFLEFSTGLSLMADGVCSFAHVYVCSADTRQCGFQLHRCGRDRLNIELAWMDQVRDFLHLLDEFSGKFSSIHWFFSSRINHAIYQSQVMHSVWLSAV